MKLPKLSERNEFLNRMKTAIEIRTHGRLAGLSFEAGAEATFIDVASPNYYGVQLVIAATNDFLSCCAESPLVALRFAVAEHRFQIRYPAKQNTVAVAPRYRSRQRRARSEAGGLAVAAT